jgi:hypothetical protein
MAEAIPVETTIEVEEIIGKLKTLPDFDRFPLPKWIHEKFNIPIIEPTSGLNEFLKLNQKAYAASVGDGAPMDIRPPAEGGVRVLKPLILTDGTEYNPAPITAAVEPIRSDLEIADMQYLANKDPDTIHIAEWAEKLKEEVKLFTLPAPLTYETVAEKTNQ